MMLIMGVMDLAGVASILPFLAVLGNPGIVENRARSPPSTTRWASRRPMPSCNFSAAVFIVVMLSIAVKAFTFYLVDALLEGGGHIHRHLAPAAISRRGPSNGSSGSIRAISATRCWRGQPGRDRIDHAGGPGDRQHHRAHVPRGLPAGARAHRRDRGGRAARALLRADLQGAAQSPDEIGRDRKAAMQERFKITTEAMGGIKEVKVRGLEDVYVRRFLKPSWRVARHQAAVEILGEMPRYVLEALAFGSMLVFILLLLWTRDGGLAEVLPVLGAFAFAGLS